MKCSYIEFEQSDNISHERERVYRRKEAKMNDKTIKD